MATPKGMRTRVFKIKRLSEYSINDNIRQRSGPFHHVSPLPKNGHMEAFGDRFYWPY